jgi:hypothetical protein
VLRFCVVQSACVVRASVAPIFPCHFESSLQRHCLPLIFVPGPTERQSRKGNSLHTCYSMVTRPTHWGGTLFPSRPSTSTGGLWHEST